MSADDNPLFEIHTPGTMLAEMDGVLARERTIDRAIEASNVSDDFKKNWEDFKGEWLKFYADHEGWFSRWPESVYQKTMEYRKRVNQWQTAFEQLSGKDVPASVPGPRPDDKPGPDGGKTEVGWKTVAVVGGVAVAAWLGWKVYRESKTKEERREKIVFMPEVKEEEMSALDVFHTLKGRD